MEIKDPNWELALKYLNEVVSAHPDDADTQRISTIISKHLGLDTPLFNFLNEAVHRGDWTQGELSTFVLGCWIGVKAMGHV